jgi:cell division protein FtsB
MSSKAAINLALIAAAAGLGIYLSKGPWVAYRQQQAKANAAHRDLDEAKITENQLLEQKAQLESPQGKAQLAREKGYRRPGEIPVEVPGH